MHHRLRQIWSYPPNDTIVAPLLMVTTRNARLRLTLPMMTLVSSVRQERAAMLKLSRSGTAHQILKASLHQFPHFFYTQYIVRQTMNAAPKPADAVAKELQPFSPKILHTRKSTLLWDRPLFGKTPSM